MQTKILVENNTYHVFKHDGIVDKLPVGVYEFRFGPMGSISLEKQSDIILPEKIYSNDTDFIEHVETSFEKIESGLIGIALVGGKGLGKSFTANKIAKDVNLPVIKITGSVGNASFTNYLKQLDQDYVLFIDEFEKIFPSSYDSDDERANQEDLLSFLDNGAGRTNKILFLITSNSEHRISDYFKNRPSRLRYFKNYEFLEEKIIKEIIDDLLINREFLNDLLENLPYNELNLDALIKIIDEINLHNKPYSKFKNFFNFKEQVDMNVLVKIKLSDGSFEEIGNINSYISCNNRMGISKKIISGRNTVIYLGDDEASIFENPKETLIVECYYYDPITKDKERGEAHLCSNIMYLANQYTF